MKWTLINPAGTNDPDTGDIYSGLDRFGRVKDNLWVDGGGSDLDRIQYGYDRAGNRLWRRNTVAAALSKEFDELYAYDGVHRLKDMARGTLNGGRTALTSETFAQCWSLDATGNWHGFREDSDGNGAWDLIQQRTANPVNEITDIAETTGPSWVTPAYSRAGNMTTMPKVADPTVSQTCQYDAWNRLTKVSEGAGTVVFLNIGSAVTGPEVYLKALSMARNVARQEGKEIRHFTTAVFDLVPLPENWRDGVPSKDDPLYYYRPWKTILTRTVADGGQSFYNQADHWQSIPSRWHAV